MIQRNQKKYSIGEVSKISGLSIPTLRFYDEKKLLVPTLRDHNSRYRYYSEDQILVALSIRELRLRDVSPKEMTEILHMPSLKTLNNILIQKQESIDRQGRCYCCTVCLFCRRLMDGDYSCHLNQ